MITNYRISSSNRKRERGSSEYEQNHHWLEGSHCTTTVMNNLELPQVLPHRFSTCDLHPDQPVTGFCAPCLRERLAGLDPANPTRLKSSTSSATVASSLKAIFRVSGGGDGNNNHRNNKPFSSGSLFPELRRSQSFSGGRGDGFSGVLEPQRKSCDVRVRSTLWNLFNLDDERKGQSSLTTTTMKQVWGEIEEVETRSLRFSGVEGPVFESKEEEEEEEEEEEQEEMVVDEEEKENEEEVRVSSDDIVVPVPPNVNLVVEQRVEEIEEEEEEEIEEVEEETSVVEEEVKTMKDHIDLESQCKKPIGGGGRDLKEIAGSFWLAASVFSKKLQKWRKKQKMKKRENGGKMRVEKRAGRHFRETQSEIADYGFARRSCDTDPRFSLDAGRMSLDAGRASLDAGRMSIDTGRISFDDPRYSWDEPRASWDGYLIGRMFPRIPPMVSVIEDCPAPVPRVDNQIPVEEPINGDVTITAPPRGSLQTKDYYSDSTKRKSLDRSNSIQKMVAEVDETKSVPNSKVSPATIDYLNGTKMDKDLRDSSSNSNSNSLRDDRSESFDSAFRDGGGDRKGSKKSRRWTKAWNIWGFIHRRGSNKDEEERCCRGNVVDRSFSESWPELRRDVNGEAKVGFNQNAFRSNSSIGRRNPSSNGGFFGRSNGETNGHSKKRREEFTLERNRSARYSPNNLDNGLLRFYLTPLRSSRRSCSGKSRQKNSHSIARNVLRLY